MVDPGQDRRTSKLRFIAKELAILVVGLVVLFVALALVVSIVVPLLGWSMCCQ
jgi:hypothetical protein